MRRWYVIWQGIYFAHGTLEAVDPKDAAMRMVRSQDRDLRTGDRILVFPAKKATTFEVTRVGEHELLEVE